MNKKDRIGTIYCIINKVNGKLYIGQTIQKPEQRLKDHYHEINRKDSHASKSIFLKALNKYKREEFLQVILWQGNSLLLNEKEVYYIKLFESKFPNGYNLAEGGGGRRGYKLPKDVVIKMSLARKGKKLSPKSLESLRLKRSQYIMSEETRKKIGDGHRGRKCSEETLEKMRNAAKGRIISDAQKEKLRIAHLGRKASEETKKKMSNSRKGRTHSEETKKKLSALKIGSKNPMYKKELHKNEVV